MINSTSCHRVTYCTCVRRRGSWWIDHISQQNLLIHSAVEFLIFGVLADLQVVTFEGLAHAETKTQSQRQRHSQYMPHMRSDALCLP